MREFFRVLNCTVVCILEELEQEFGPWHVTNLPLLLLRLVVKDLERVLRLQKSCELLGWYRHDVAAPDNLRHFIGVELDKPIACVHHKQGGHQFVVVGCISVLPLFAECSQLLELFLGLV